MYQRYKNVKKTAEFKFSMLFFLWNTDIINDMNNFSVIINSIEIKNLKNVFNGKIVISKKPESNTSKISSDIVGIYGQNGSGKTTVIKCAI